MSCQYIMRQTKDTGGSGLRSLRMQPCSCESIRLHHCSQALSGIAQDFLSVCKLHIHSTSFFLLAAKNLFVMQTCCESRLGFQATPWKIIREILSEMGRFGITQGIPNFNLEFGIGRNSSVFRGDICPVSFLGQAFLRILRIQGDPKNGPQLPVLVIS